MLDDKETITDVLQTLLKWKAGEGDNAAETAAFDASAGVEVDPPEEKHEIRVDKAMALWAQAACGNVVVSVYCLKFKPLLSNDFGLILKKGQW